MNKLLIVISLLFFSFSLPTYAESDTDKKCETCVHKCLGLGHSGGGEAPPHKAVKSCEKSCKCTLTTEKEDVS